MSLVSRLKPPRFASRPNHHEAQPISRLRNSGCLLDKEYYSQIGFYNQGWYGAPRTAMLALQASF